MTKIYFQKKASICLKKSKEKVRKQVGEIKNYTDHATYNLSETKSEMLEDAKKAGIMYDQKLDPDIRSLR